MVAGFEAGDVGELRLRAAVAHHRKLADVLHALHAILRELHLDLEGIAGRRIAPVVRLGEARRRGRGHDGAHDVRHRQAELAGALAVDRDIERRVVVLLRVLQVAQEAELCRAAPAPFARSA